MSRPTTTVEFIQRLTAGDRFKQRDRSGVIMELRELELPEGMYMRAFSLVVNCSPRDNMVIFLGKDYLVKVESTEIFNISPVVREQLLFFVEIEFLD